MLIYVFWSIFLFIYLFNLIYLCLYLFVCFCFHQPKILFFKLHYVFYVIVQYVFIDYVYYRCFIYIIYLLLHYFNQFLLIYFFDLSLKTPVLNHQMTDVFYRRCSLRSVTRFSCHIGLDVLLVLNAVSRWCCGSHLFISQQSAPVEAGRQIKLVQLAVEISVGAAVFGPALVQVTHTTHTFQKKALVLRAGWCVLRVCVCSLTPARSRWPAGAAAFWLCSHPWRDPSVRSQPGTDSRRQDPAVWEESPRACSPGPDRRNTTDTESLTV